MDKFYTGVGSRTTPKIICDLMTLIAQKLCQDGFILRSGGADGADKAFEAGAGMRDVYSHIYIPWKGFNGYSEVKYPVTQQCLDIAATCHPVWDRLSRGAQYLHGRNVMQVLGHHLDRPSNFLLCWTPDGCKSASERTSRTGGTGTAIELATRFNVPVYNLGFEEHLLRMLKYVNLPFDEKYTKVKPERK